MSEIKVGDRVRVLATNIDGAFKELYRGTGTVDTIYEGLLFPYRVLFDKPSLLALWCTVEKIEPKIGFTIGDRVRVRASGRISPELIGADGTVVVDEGIILGVEFDKELWYGHNLGRPGMGARCQWMHLEDLILSEEKKETPSITTPEQFEKLFEEMVAEEKDCMCKKGKDYAGNNDRLNNFKEIATLLDLPVIKVWAVYFYKHIMSITTYVKNGSVSSESIESRFMDARNYLALGRAIIEEAKRGK